MLLLNKYLCPAIHTKLFCFTISYHLIMIPMNTLYRLLSLLLLLSCNVTQAQQDSIVDGHPAWTIRTNIYEVNVRQYTPEGTFKAFEKNLDRLKDMGVETLWFMPINPISKVDRKGALGSYYAVSDFNAINPEFGNMDNW